MPARVTGAPASGGMRPVTTAVAASSASTAPTVTSPNVTAAPVRSLTDDTIMPGMPISTKTPRETHRMALIDTSGGYLRTSGLYFMRCG